MKHKLCFKVIGLVCLLSILLCSCGNKLPVPDSPVDVLQDTLSITETEMLECYPIIVQGEVEKVIHVAKPEEYQGHLAVTTLVLIRIERTLKGDITEQSTILISLDGDGENYITSLVSASGGYYSKGDITLLFLQKPTEAQITNFKKNYPKQYRKYKQTPYICNAWQGRFWLDEEGNILHERNVSKRGLFTDCATVDELVEKYGLN